MAVAKPARDKQTRRPPNSVARNGRSPKLQGQGLRRDLEELRDTKSDRRARELKNVIADSICSA